MTDYAKYDSDDTFIAWNIRLTADPTVRDGANGPMVTLKWVCTSRNDGDADIWVEATASDRQAALAQCLKKGDVLGIQGKLCMRTWGEGKIAMQLRRAELHVPISLLMACKERGFVPGAAPSKPRGAVTIPKKTVFTLDDGE